MASEKKADLICHGELGILKYTKEIEDEVVEFYKNNFLINENVSVCCEMAKNEHSVAEIEAVVRYVLQDQLGFVVRHVVTKELVAICINNISHARHESTSEFQFQTPGVLCGYEFVNRVKGSIDLFEEMKIDCAMEIVFLSTRNDFGGRGLALILSERSVDFARQMLKGDLPDIDSLPDNIKNLKPKAVTALFTSLFTQKIGEKLGMKTFVSIPFTEFFFNGKSFAEKINPIHEVATYAAMKLELN